MTKRRITSLALAAFLMVISTVYLWAKPGYTVEYPQGYRKWTHVMSYVIGPQSPAYEKNGGLHHLKLTEERNQDLKRRIPLHGIGPFKTY